METKKHFIMKLKEAKENGCYSNRSFAAKLRISPTTLKQWLDGKRLPNYRSLNSIYKNIGIKPNELFGIEKPKQ